MNTPNDGEGNMDSHSDLSGLLGRVEEATGADRELDAALTKALDAKAWAKFRNWASMPCGAPEDVVERGAARYAEQFTASLDAALGLCERILPGWTRMVDENFGLGEQTVWTGYVFTPRDQRCAQFEGYSNAPALALLAAMLKALIASTANPEGDAS